MTFYKIKLILHFILLSLWEGSDFRLMINQPSVGIIDANILFLWFVPYEHKPKTIKDYLKSQGIINKKIVTRHEIMEALVMKFTLGYYPKNYSNYRHAKKRIDTWGMVFPNWIENWNNPDSLFKASIDERLDYLSTKKTQCLRDGQHSGMVLPKVTMR